MGAARGMRPAWGSMDDDANPETGPDDVAPGRGPSPEDLEALARYAAVLDDGVRASLPGWVERSVERVHVAQLQRRPPAEVRAAATEAGHAAAADVGARVHALLALDIDEQRSNPLALIRQAVPTPPRCCGPPVSRPWRGTSSRPASSPTMSTTWPRPRSRRSTPSSTNRAWCGARRRPTSTCPGGGPRASAERPRRSPTSVRTGPCGYGPGMTERLVVIGGDAGGMAAASKVRRLRPDVEIIVIERGGRTSYAMCGIPYVVGGEVDDVESLVARSPEEFGAMDIEVRLHTDAISVDLDRRTVETRDIESGATEVVAFDQLMIGTGARPVVPDWAEVDLPHVSVVHTLPDAALLDGLAGGCAGRDVVSSAAATSGSRWPRPSWRGAPGSPSSTGTPHLMRTLDPDMAELVDEAGPAPTAIELRLGVHVDGVRRRHAVHHRRPAPSSAPTSSCSASACGPTPSWPTAAGLSSASAAPIRVDRPPADARRRRVRRRRLRRVVPPRQPAAGARRPRHRGQPTGRVAGINIGGGYATFPGVVGTAITKVVRHRDRPHRPDRAPRPTTPASMPWPPPSRARPGPATSRGRSRSRSSSWSTTAPGACSAARSWAATARPSASTRSPRRITAG